MKSPDVTEKVNQFFDQFTLRSYDKGEILLHAGDDVPHVYFLLDGRIRQYDISRQGDELVLNIFKPGAFLPMLPIVAGVPNHYFFEAESKLRVRVAPAAAVRDFLEKNPDVLMDLLARVYRGVDGVMGRLAQLMAGTARARLLYELVMVCKRFGVERTGGLYVAFHETDLAEQAGLQRETVSRELANLKRSGVVSVTRAGITVRDLAELESEFAKAVRN